MIVCQLIDPFEFKEEILSIGNEAFGEGYLDSLVLKRDSVQCFGALDGDQLIGFTFFYFVDNHSILTFDVNVLSQSSNQVIFLKSVIVKPEYRRRGVASMMISQIEVMGELNGVTHYYADAWLTINGLTSGQLFKKLGYQIIKQIDQFWYADSLLKGYSCSECGKAPCLCSAVIFVKGSLLCDVVIKQ